MYDLAAEGVRFNNAATLCQSTRKDGVAHVLYLDFIVQLMRICEGKPGTRNIFFRDVSSLFENLKGRISEPSTIQHSISRQRSCSGLNEQKLECRVFGKNPYAVILWNHFFSSMYKEGVQETLDYPPLVFRPAFAFWQT